MLSYKEKNDKKKKKTILQLTDGYVNRGTRKFDD